MYEDMTSIMLSCISANVILHEQIFKEVVVIDVIQICKVAEALMHEGYCMMVVQRSMQHFWQHFHEQKGRYLQKLRPPIEHVEDQFLVVEIRSVALRINGWPDSQDLHICVTINVRYKKALSMMRRRFLYA